MIAQYLYFSTGILLWISAAFIFIRKSERSFYFIGGHLIIMGLGIITRTLAATGQIEQYPHFYQILSPLHFLYGPLYFYFLVTFFRPRYQFQLKDGIHLIPFLLHLIDYLPFYVSSPENKRLLMLSGADVSAFGIPLMYYNLFKSISFISYFILVGWFYINFIYNTRFSDPRMTRLVHLWLRGDYLLKFIALLSYIFLIFVTKQYALSASFYLFSLDSFLNIFVIFMYPNLLKGIRIEYVQGSWFRPSTLLTKLQYRIRILLKQGNSMHALEQKLHYVMDIQLCFLDHQLNASVLSGKLHLDLIKLDHYFQVNCGCSCQDYIDFKRLEFLLKQSAFDGAWENLPLFKSVFNAGFNSVTSMQTTLIRYHDAVSLRCFHFDQEILNGIKIKLAEMLKEDK